MVTGEWNETAQVKASPRLPARPKGEVIAFFVKDEKKKEYLLSNESPVFNITPLVGVSWARKVEAQFTEPGHYKNPDIYWINQTMWNECLGMWGN